ncbi:MAG TPA: FimV/HubP family polar landmark protein [Rhodanobacteraceae bacterium]|nr:FimV/HubP family polar landmark protein [Rhodanobacteraceae bacterium]
MKSTYKLTLAIALCLGSSQALALQLGQIRVKSALDEPLVAEIPIQLDNLNEAKGLSVGLASDADFARAGLSRAGLEHLRFGVVSDSTGHKIVLVTSDQPISDPYLDFLVQVNTSKGKQLREYTVLLDPVIATPIPQLNAPSTAPVAPVAPSAPPPPSTTPPANVSSAPVQQPKPAAPAPAPAAPPPATQPVQQVAAPAQPRGQVVVQNGDTLYRIASQNRPDPRISVDQMMLALQKANPDAFYRDNINALKSGAILRIPTRDAVSALGIADARAQVRRQMEDWTGAAARKATTVVQNNPAAAAPAQPGPARTATETDRLALVPSTQGGGGAASRPGEKGGTGTVEIAGLKQQLATAKESLTSLKQENADLQSRVKDLESISSNNQKLLGLKDAEIAELQRKLAEAQQQAAKPAPTPPPVANAAGAPEPATTSAGSTAQGGAKSEPTAKPALKAAPQNVQSQGIAEPWYRQPLAWIIAGVVILGLILLGLVRRRPRPLPEPESEGPSSPPDHYAAAGPAELVPETHEEHLHMDEPQAAEPEPEPEPVAEHHVEQPQPSEEYHFNFDEVAPEEPPVAAPGMAAPQPPLAGADEPTRPHGIVDVAGEPEQAGFQPAPELDQDEDITREHPVPDFSDDPVDTKLDLARAYLDMGDPEGARAMLEEVLSEGSQMQKDEAKRLLEGVA